MNGVGPKRSHKAVLGSMCLSEQESAQTFGQPWSNVCDVDWPNKMVELSSRHKLNQYRFTLVHRLRRWTNVKPILIQRIVSAG